MPLTKLQFKPGVNRETTSYTNEGGWYDGDKVRFRFGFPEKIGGWVKHNSTQSFLGACRSLFPWVALDFSRYLGVGTNKKYYVETGGAFYDITPIRYSNELNASITVSVSGTSGTTAVGSITKSDNVATVTGVEGTGGVGSPIISTDDDITPVISSPTLTGSVGEVTIGGNLDVSVTLDGVEGTGEVGSPLVSGENVTVFDDLIFSATDGSSTITVTVNEAHGATVGDFVTFSGVDGLGGNITAGVLNQEYEISTIPSNSTFTFEARLANTTIQSITVDGQLTPTPVVANYLDTGDGGITSVAFYQITTGLDSAVFGNGWGAGSWSRGAWGSAAQINVETDTLRLWNEDSFGEDLIINYRDGGIYYWDESLGLNNNRAVELSSLSGANKSPTVAKQVMVADERHVLVFGCDLETTPGVQDSLAIRFSDQESVTDWETTVANTAGEIRLSSGSEIVQAVKTRQQILVFTDTTMYALQYLGPPFTYGSNVVSQNITIMSPKSAVAFEDNVMWMGTNEFYIYGGQVQKLPCTVRDYVFDDLNEGQAEKIFGSLNTESSEIWWFYPSASSESNDRYVVYNYLEKVWYYGDLSRTAWVDRGVFTRPIAASTDAYLYDHEEGFDDGSTNPASPINAYLESSQIDIGDGDSFAFIRRLIPDITFRDSTASAPSALMTLKTRNFPGGDYLQSKASTVEKSASVPVEQFTEQAHVRLRGRSFAFRISSEDTGVSWRLGSPRVDIRPDGRR